MPAKIRSTAQIKRIIRENPGIPLELQEQRYVNSYSRELVFKEEQLRERCHYLTDYCLNNNNRIVIPNMDINYIDHKIVFSESPTRSAFISIDKFELAEEPKVLRMSKKIL